MTKIKTRNQISISNNLCVKLQFDIYRLEYDPRIQFKCFKKMYMCYIVLSKMLTKLLHNIVLPLC